MLNNELLNNRKINENNKKEIEMKIRILNKNLYENILKKNIKYNYFILENNIIYFIKYENKRYIKYIGSEKILNKQYELFLKNNNFLNEYCNKIKYFQL